jgi:energy-coupling factor transporter ATP-binding protein EcfA2
MCNVSLKHPFRALIVGPSGSGKTNLTKSILQGMESLISPYNSPNSVYYFYNTWQPLYQEMKDENLVTSFIKGSPDSDEFKTLANKDLKRGGSLFIIDDSINISNPHLIEIFTTLSHHCDASVIFISQNLFVQNSEFRTISLNCQYFFIMKSPRDMHQINAFAKQMFPGENNFIIEAYKHATDEPYSYLLFDAHQETPQFLRVRARIFSREQPMIVYFNKNNNKII